MAAILLLIIVSAAEKQWLGILGALGIFIILLLSCPSKEPTLVRAGIAISWLLTQYLPHRGGIDAPWLFRWDRKPRRMSCPVKLPPQKHGEKFT